MYLICELVYLSVSRYHVLFEFDHECGAFMPVGCHLGGEVAAVEDSLYDPGLEGRAVQGALVLGHGDKS